MLKGNLQELLKEKMNSRENQVFNLLLINYIFSRKTGKRKAETERSVWVKLRQEKSYL